MGARPIAAMNALRFGEPDPPKTKTLVSGVVAGVGGYGNSFGVPTVGGEVEFDARYNGNCLVNAFAAGLAEGTPTSLSIRRPKASACRRPYLGAKTGRDGWVGGANDGVGRIRRPDSRKSAPRPESATPFTEEWPAGSLASY